jgi:hypothetical protein
MELFLLIKKDLNGHLLRQNQTSQKRTNWYVTQKSAALDADAANDIRSWAGSISTPLTAGQVAGG